MRSFYEDLFFCKIKSIKLVYLFTQAQIAACMEIQWKFCRENFTSLINHQHNFKIRKKDFTKTKFQTNFVGFETVGALESPKVTAKLDTIWKQLA